MNPFKYRSEPAGPECGSAGNGWRVAFIALVSTLYCTAFLAAPLPLLPQAIRRAFQLPKQFVYRTVTSFLNSVGIVSPSHELVSGVYLLLLIGVTPWLVMAIIGRGRPHDLGLRRPNRIGWRASVFGYLTALPLLYWMSLGDRFAPYYLPHLERVGVTAFGLFYAVNMLTEHFFFHGVLLGLFRADLRWPAPPSVVEDATRGSKRLLQWLGLAQPTAGAHRCQRVTRWLGLPDGCLLSITVSALLFALVHVGKDPRELLLSLPGGLAQGYLAYRTNSWLVPLMLHVATAGTALLMAVAG